MLAQRKLTRTRHPHTWGVCSRVSARGHSWICARRMHSMHALGACSRGARGPHSGPALGELTRSMDSGHPLRKRSPATRQPIKARSSTKLCATSAVEAKLADGDVMGSGEHQQLACLRFSEGVPRSTIDRKTRRSALGIRPHESRLGVDIILHDRVGKASTPHSRAI